jgi:hypothetical protein
MNSPMTIDGADSRMSLMKRDAGEDPDRRTERGCREHHDHRTDDRIGEPATLDVRCRRRLGEQLQ